MWFYICNQGNFSCKCWLQAFYNHKLKLQIDIFLLMPRHMISGKCVSNIWWKLWLPYANIQVLSSSLPTTQRPWRFTHCGGMGELFKKCWITTWSTPPLWIMKPYYHKDMERQTWLFTFRWNCVKLGWAFINIMNAIHHSIILHNDLSKEKIMLHFPPNKPNVMYIGVYDLGEAKGLQEVMPSLYGFAKEQDVINAKKVHWWGA